jgi:transposase-like protein
MSEKRRQFTREFKMEAVRLVKQGQSASSVAAALGTGRQWCAPGSDK